MKVFICVCILNPDIYFSFNPTLDLFKIFSARFNELSNTLVVPTQI